MSLRHILLGMLAEPASGYDLREEFSRSVAYFWSAELSQIYPTLARLEKEGLLECRSVPSDKGPDRKVYTRTRRGRAELRAWLEEGPALRQERIPFLAQVMFLEALPPSKRVRFLEDLKADFESRLGELEAAERQWRAADPRYPDALPHDDFHAQLTLELGKARYRATIAWCEACIERMEKRLAPATSRRASAG